MVGDGLYLCGARLSTRASHALGRRSVKPKRSRRPAAFGDVAEGRNSEEGTSLRLDESLLDRIGLSPVRGEAKPALLRALYETLELRVGHAFASQMTDDQLDAFETIIDRNDEATGHQWLQTHFPRYEEVVRYELDHMISVLSAVMRAEKSRWEEAFPGITDPEGARR